MLDDIIEENKELVLKKNQVPRPLKLKLFTLDMYHDGGVTTDYELATILKRINDFYGSKIECQLFVKLMIDSQFKSTQYLIYILGLIYIFTYAIPLIVVFLVENRPTEKVLLTICLVN